VITGQKLLDWLQTDRKQSASSAAQTAEGMLKMKLIQPAQVSEACQVAAATCSMALCKYVYKQLFVSIYFKWLPLCRRACQPQH